MTEGRADERSLLLSVLVPAYREAATIFANLQLLQDSLTEFGRPFEIIVVSDGSDDDTHLEAARHESIKVLHYEQQRGKGFALRHGITHCDGDVIAFIDADMELHPAGLRHLVELIEEGADVAIGSKRHPESVVHYPFLRRLQSAAYQKLIHLLFDLQLTDTQTGLKAFRADFLNEVLPHLISDGFALDLELLVEINNRGGVIIEGPIQLDYAFESTTSLRSVVNVLADTLRIYRKHPDSRRQRRTSANRRLLRPRLPDARLEPVSRSQRAS